MTEEIFFDNGIKLTLYLYYRGTKKFVSNFKLEAPDSSIGEYIQRFRDEDQVTIEDAIQQAKWGSGLKF
jgi:hypothetical protein